MASTAVPVPDVFIWFGKADKAWVEGFLQPALDTCGVSVGSEASFEFGTRRVEEFENSIETSRYTLLVLSLASQQDTAQAFIDDLAQQHKLESGRSSLIAILRGSVELRLALRVTETVDADDPAQIDRLCRQISQRSPQPSEPPECPYPGLPAFAEAERDVLFGRAAQVEKVNAWMQLQHLVTITASGSGKSSFVSAGLVPALRTSREFGNGEWLFKWIRPGNSPTAALRDQLGIDNLAEIADATPRLRATNGSATRLLLIVDQLEELFTVADDSSTTDFLGALLTWRSDRRQILVAFGDGQSATYPETYVDGMPQSSSTPPPGLYEPIRGFGKLWRDEVYLVNSLGWALGPERGFLGAVQDFENGVLIWTGDEQLLVRVVYNDGGWLLVHDPNRLS